MRNLAEKSNQNSRIVWPSSYLSNNPICLESENKKKEIYLYKKLQQIESKLKSIELDLTSINTGEENNLLHLLFNRFHDDLEEIDNLFIKVDYMDTRGANLIMDEIDDKLISLSTKIDVTTRH